MRSRCAPVAALAAAVCLAGCGGGADEKASAAPTALVSNQAFKACLDRAGLEYGRRWFTPRSERPAGLQSLRLQVALGEASPEDPAEPGTFEYFAHVHVFDTAAHAEAFDAVASGNNFAGGEADRNVYAGYNLDAAKVADTPNGPKFLNCLRTA
jgi:hypothetical protein